MSWIIHAGDGSERCLVCGLRQADKSYYVNWLPREGPVPESQGYPCCSWAHAYELTDRFSTL